MCEEEERKFRLKQKMEDMSVNADLGKQFSRAVKLELHP